MTTTAIAERLDNRPFRELLETTLEAERITFGELARRAEMDPERLRVALGMKHYIKYDRLHKQTTISYSLAVRLVRACGAWPVDYGV